MSADGGDDDRGGAAGQGLNGAAGRAARNDHATVRQVVGRTIAGRVPTASDEAFVYQTVDGLAASPRTPARRGTSPRVQRLRTHNDDDDLRGEGWAGRLDQDQ